MRLQNMTKLSRRLSLRTQLIVSFIIVITIPLFIIGYRYYIESRNVISDIAEKNMYDVVKKNNQILDSKLNQAKDNILSFIVDKDLYSAFLTIKPTDDYEINRLNKQVSVVMEKYFLHLKDIFSAQLATSYTTFYPDLPQICCGSKNFIPEGLFVKTRMYQEAVAEKGKIVWIPTYDFTEMFDVPYLKNSDIDYRYLFSAVEMVTGTFFDGTTYSTAPSDIERPVLLVNYKEDFYRDVFKTSLSAKGSYYFVVTKDGQYVSHMDQKKIGKKDNYPWLQTLIDRGSGTARVKIDGEETILCFDTSSVTGWVSVVGIPSNKLLNDLLHTIKVYLVYSFILLIVLFILISYFLTGRITKPLLNLFKAFKQTGEGNFEISVNEKGSKELVVLSKRFMDMNEKIQKLINENYESKIKEKEAEITALNLQLDPHFMYNTLNLINLVSVENGQDEISEMIVSLSKMLKYTIKTNTDRVLFNNDWEYLQSYIYIMSKRFEDRFVVETNVDPRLLVYGVPKFFLQPFVENVFVHAFSERSKGGRLAINGRLEEDIRVFEVIDNGNGIDEGTVKRVLSSDTSSIGIQNVHKRIQIMYGEQYGVSIESKPGQGTKVTIRIPKD